MALWRNPTGGKIRPRGKLGSGRFGASRDNGKRKHRGTDYLFKEPFPKQVIVAVTAGYIGKIGYPYSDDLTFRYVQINPPDGSEVKQFYVKPLSTLKKGQRVQAGQKLGMGQSLQKRYKRKVPDHCHVQILGWRNPETLIPS